MEYRHKQQGPPSPPSGAFVVRMRFPRIEDLQYRYTKDISRGGVFIQTLRPKPIGTRVVLVLEQADRDERVSLEGEVVTSLGADDAAARGVQPGMGIRFLDLSAEKRRAIEDIIAAGVLAANTSSAPAEPTPNRTTSGTDIVSVTAEAEEFLAKAHATDHYGLLGVARDANSGEVRRAFLKLTKRFHPDNYFRRAPEELCRQLEDIYDILTQAYETLMDRDRRISYDLSIENLAGNRDGVSADEMQRVASEQRRRQADPGRMNRADQLVAQARQELAAGQDQKALGNLKLALAFDPENEQIKAKIEEVKDRLRNA